MIESEGEDRVKKKLGRKTPSAAGRKGKSVLPLFKGKCAPVPIVSWLTGSYGGGQTRGVGGLSSWGFTTSEGGGRKTEIQKQRLKGYRQHSK